MHRSPLYRAPRRAFTLIELLVVIAIIAILAAILFPVLAQAKQAAKKSYSLSSVKQIVTGYMLYSNDNGDVEIPGPYYWTVENDGSTTAIGMQEMLQPYIRNTKVWINPAGTQNPADFGSGYATQKGLKVTSNYVFPIWSAYGYYGRQNGNSAWPWDGYTGKTEMFAGFPVPPNENSMGYFGACGARNAAFVAMAECVGYANVAYPSNAAILLPGVIFSYFRPGTSDMKYEFGQYSAASYRSVVDELTPRVWSFDLGMNIGMADGSAKFYRFDKFNHNDSETRLVRGYAYKASPYMRVR